MPGKRYSAGAIFLQVVPVFANVQNAIANEAKNIDRALGDQMEDSGRKAGKRAGKAMGEEIGAEGKKAADNYAGHFETSIKNFVKGANKELGRLDLSTASQQMLKDLDTAKAKLKDLNDQDFNLDFDSKKVLADLAGLRAVVEGLTKGKHELNIDSNIRKVLADLEASLAFIDREIDKTREIEIEVEVDTKAAERQMTTFEKQFKKTAERAASHLSGSMNKEVKRIKQDLKALEDLRIGIDISADRARKELAELMAELEALSSDDQDIEVRLDTTGAFAELAAFESALARVDGDDINIDVNVDTAGARAGLFGLKRSGDDAANSFRSFNVVLLAAAGAGPALIPILGAIAGGLLAIGPAAAVGAAGIGSVLIGFSGIGDALTALQARDDEMGQAAAKSSQAAVDGARAVADARRSAARQIESALDAQADAQERYRDSVDDVRDAEQALADARAAAKATGRNLNEQISDNQLAQDQGLLDVFNATVNFNAVQADGSATNAEKEQARIELERARDALSDLRREARELAKEKKKWDEEGVNGTEEVQSAQEGLNDAIEAQKDAYEDLRDAAQAVDQARADGARAVADAMRNQAQAMDAVSTQQQNLDTAMNKLGPAGQKFALFIHSLKDDFYSFRDDIQTVLLPAVQMAIEDFFGSDSGRVMRDALIGLADSFGKFTQALSASFQGEAWLGFFTMLRDTGPTIQKLWGSAFISFLEGMASIMTALAPFAVIFARGLARVAEAFADWAASKEGQDAIADFMAYAVSVAPDVIDFLKALGKFAVTVARGLAEWGDVVLTGITGLLNALAGMDPAVLAAIVTTLFVLITASQTAYAIMNLLMAGAALFSSTVGLWVFAIVGVALGLAYLYKTNKSFRDFIKKAWKEIKQAFVEAWEAIKPALAELWDAIKELWDKVLQPFFEWLGPIVLWVIKKIIPFLAKAFADALYYIAWLISEVLVPGILNIAKFMKWLWQDVLKPVWGFIKKAWGVLVDAIVDPWNGILKPAWKAIATLAKWLWNEALEPTWKSMKKGWDALMSGMKWVWQHVLKPVWDFITDKALPKLQGAFETVVEAIQKIWGGLKKVVGAPIKFVLDTIINNGLIDGFNKIASWVHIDPIKHIPIPEALQSFATGGVMPGYTPGRDPHKFVSPTGGRLELSGGEAIMRPEWTAAMGTGYVNGMNDLAARQGVAGIKKAMFGQQFAKGGVFFPVPGGYIKRSEYNINHDGVDINAAGDEGPSGLGGVTPFYSATTGQVSMTGYDRGYGNAIFINSPYGELVYGHSYDGSIAVSPGQHVMPGQYLARIGTTGNSTGPHLHFGFPGGTFAAAMSLLDGSSHAAGDPAGGKHHRAIPGWLMSIIKNPFAAVKGWITDPIKKAASFVTDSPAFDFVSKVPLLAAKAVTDKVWNVVPGFVKTAAGWAGAGADWVAGGVNAAQDATSIVGGALGDAYGFKDGGILPYNGTMKYDNGGYLPPGLTSVVNLTGRPEPVFTGDQWDGMGGDGDGTIHYEPHFEGSNLTADDVAGDLNFTLRRIKRSGKYGKVGAQS